MLVHPIRTALLKYKAPNTLHLVNFRYIPGYLLRFLYPLSPSDAPTSKTVFLPPPKKYTLDLEVSAYL